MRTNTLVAEQERFAEAELARQLAEIRWATSATSSIAA
jgi:hypothetical protein